MARMPPTKSDIHILKPKRGNTTRQGRGAGRIALAIVGLVVVYFASEVKDEFGSIPGTKSAVTVSGTCQ